jgi:hypothetical protein
MEAIMSKSFIFSGGEFSAFIDGDRLINNTHMIPDSPGVYAVMKKDDSSLVYVGQAKGKLKTKPRSLRDRFIKEHFKKRARGSALRRHVAMAMGIPLYRDHSGHLAADPKHEDNISKFINDKLCVAFLVGIWDDVKRLEDDAIRELTPIWNFQHSVD